MTARAITRSARAALFAALLAGGTLPAPGAGFGFNGDAAVGQFSDADLQLFRTTAADMLEYAPDGASRRWTNPESGNHGRIKIIRTLSPKEAHCRLTRISNEIKKQRFKTSNVYTFCRGADGNWTLRGEPAGTVNR